ncbi:MAG: YhgE/Pip domain-containing protein [Rubrobacteraceae bacterium]
MGVVVLAFFYFLVNFGAARSPVANTRGLPVAVVNGDSGAKLGGERVDLGSRVVRSATTSKKIGSAVEWTRLGSREAAMRGISRGEYDGALVIPRDYSRSIANLAAPPELPVAIVNEDSGAEIGGKPVDFGRQVVDKATGEKKLRGVIHWSKVSGEKQALEGFSKGEYAAAVVIPRDYSGRLASFASPPTGKAPEQAQLRLLINPAADSSTLSTVKQIFSGITGTTSEATGEKLSGALAEANVSIPAGEAPLLGNPVREQVEAAHPSGGSKAPETAGAEPARVEILTNQSAGPFPSGTVQTILSRVVLGASESTGEKLTGALADKGAKVSPGQAAALATPVVAKVTDAQPTGTNSGRGLMPFYLMFTASILGFIGANAIYGGFGDVAEGAAAKTGRTPSFFRLFAGRTAFAVLLSLMLGAVETLVALAIYGVHHEAGPLYVFGFLSLVASVSLMLGLLLLSVFGPRVGILAGSLLIISLGLATSGGTTPIQNLPDFFRSLAVALPFVHATDGIRALLFYGGRLDAGLGTGLWVLAVYLAGAVLISGCISLARDIFSRRQTNVDREKVPRPEATEALR